MNLLKAGKRLAEALVYLSILSVTVTPVTNLIGIEPPQQFQDIRELVQYTLLSGIILLVLTILTIIVAGYLTLTGWRNYKAFPKPLQIGFAFVLGVIALSLASPLSTVIPVPFLPTAIAAFSLWAILRALSSHFTTIKTNESVTARKAIARALTFIRNQLPQAQDLAVVEATRVGPHWKIGVVSHTSKTRYEVKLEAHTGDVLTWHSA